MCDLSLAEARGLRSGDVCSIRRAVDPGPIEIRADSWSWTAPGSMRFETLPFDQMRARVVSTALWRSGDLVLLREPWAVLDADNFGCSMVAYRADGDVATRIKGSPMPTSVVPEWETAATLPEWAWRMKARVLGVSALPSEIEPVGHAWAIAYEVKVMNA